MAAVVIVKRHRSGNQANGTNTSDPGAESFVENLPSPEVREMDSVMRALLLGYETKTLIPNGTQSKLCHSVWQTRRVVITKEILAFSRENEETIVDQVNKCQFIIFFEHSYIRGFS